MSDMTTTGFNDFMREARGPITENYPSQTALMSLFERVVDVRDWQGGTHIRQPLILHELEGAHGAAEGATINEPHTLITNQSQIEAVVLYQPISITDELMEDSANVADTSWKEAAGTLMEQATRGLALKQNFFFNHAGLALIVNINAATTDTTLNVGTAVPWQLLRVGGAIDVRVRATGAPTTNGTRRRITAVNKVTGIVTCGDGGGNFSTSTSDGVYVAGSYGKAWTSIQEIAAATGTFQNLDKGTVPQWQGIDGRNGDTTTVDLSEPILDAAEMYVEEESGRTPSHYVGDPAVINRYSQTHLALQRFGGDVRESSTGFKAVAYHDKLLFHDHMHKRSTVHGLDVPSYTQHSATAGPDWYDFGGGAMFHNFNRSPVREAWLRDRGNLGTTRCNGTTAIANLSRAT